MLSKSEFSEVLRLFDVSVISDQSAAASAEVQLAGKGKLGQYLAVGSATLAFLMFENWAAEVSLLPSQPGGRRVDFRRPVAFRG